MILTLIILFVLVSGFFTGLRRGLVFQIVDLTGFIVALAAAYLYFDNFAPYLRWIPYLGSSGGNVENFYYQAIAFLILFIGIRFLWNIVGSAFDFLANLPLLGMVNRWLGGAFGAVKGYLVIFILLNLVAFIPIFPVQQAVSDSTLAQTIVQDTPLLSEKVEEL
ncbi:MAG: CvpA family protein [Tetragenococcus koreensis]|nr:CvpA family protein [Tetragenococcus koreensis]